MSKELVVISGKGDMEETSIVVSLAALADKVLLGDCEVYPVWSAYSAEPYQPARSQLVT